MGRKEAFEQYRDASGNPQFAESCVLFFDLLGVSAMAQDPDALTYLNQLRPALEQASERAGTDDAGQTHASTWFTDNVVVATPVFRFPQDQEGALLFTIVNVSYLFLILLERGFLGRGGIGFGDHYMDDRFVFGPALIAAAELEKNTKQPRIALTEDAAQLAAKVATTSGYGQSMKVPHVRALAIDLADQTVFVDTFGLWLAEEDDDELAEYLLEKHRQGIENGIRSTAGDPKVQDKWLWLADYFNWSIKAYGERKPSALVTSAPGTYEFVYFFEVLSW